MKSVAELKKFVIDRIESRKEEIISLGTELLNNPESGYCEVKTAAKVKAELERLGLTCRTGLAVTGIRADIKCGKGDGPRIALMGELDALPVPSHPFADPATGAAHACGHHAQLTQMLAAAEALLPIVDELSGSLAFIAVPAEEFQALDYCRKLIAEEKIRYCGGKPEFIRLGVLDDIDMVLLIHAGHDTFTPESYNGFCMKEIVFEGRAAHGGLRPWAGINAASMARQALNMIDAQRDTFDDKDSVRIHGIISNGGDAVNVVPAKAVLELQIRAKTPEAVANACKTVDRSVKAAAMAFGGKVTIHNLGGYMPYVSNAKLNKVHGDNLMELTGKVLGNFGHRGSSTDMGDVSMLMPALHAYSGGFAGSPHGADFVVDDPVLAYVEGAKLLAMDVITLLGDEAGKGKEIAAEKSVMDKENYLKYKESMSSKEEFKYDQA